MKKENGKVILGTKECSCGDGTIEPLRPCPRYNMRQNRIPCPHCGSTSRNGHHYLKQPRITCPNCEGTLIIPEGICDNIPDAWWQEFNFKVYRSERPQTFNEAYLGLGTCFGLTDYGRYKSQTDDEIIADVKKHTWTQAIKVVDKELNLADEIAILCNNNGYSVVAMLKGKPVRGA